MLLQLWICSARRFGITRESVAARRLFKFKIERRVACQTQFVFFLEHFLSELVQIRLTIAYAVCLMSKVACSFLAQTSDHTLVATKTVESFSGDAFSRAEGKNVHRCARAIFRKPICDFAAHEFCLRPAGIHFYSKSNVEDNAPRQLPQPFFNPERVASPLPLAERGGNGSRGLQPTVSSVQKFVAERRLNSPVSAGAVLVG